MRGKMITVFAAASAAVLLAGCSSTQGSDSEASSEPAEIVSSPGMDTWNEQVIKNSFFSTQQESCGDISTSTSDPAYSAFITCESAGTYMWFFSDSEERDALMPEILEKDLPLLVSEKWVIASGLDLEMAQREIGGAINLP